MCIPPALTPHRPLLPPSLPPSLPPARLRAQAQDLIAYLEPPARLVIELREKQKAWDDAQAALPPARGTPFKSAARRALGARPSLTL